MYSKRPFGDEGDLRRIAGEYREMPGLKLTAAQASRLWACDLTSSQTALDSLAEQGLLRRTDEGFYVLLTGSPTRARSSRRAPSLSFSNAPTPSLGRRD